MAPPYCGLPSLSHQFPFAVVVVLAVVVMSVAVVVGVYFVVIVDVGIDVAVDVVVDVAQDAKSNDITTRQVSNIQIAPFFI